ncbi:hypothetical protein [Brassicibacter mesophilus]|uniref:hypothetical protein n=1 Tax=Brassicibacter mesophilus TaxID=745119 RepID=UPI003D1BACF0
MKDFISLRILDKFSIVFKKLGINYSMMRKILELKLTMDERRVPTALSSYKNKNKDGNLLKKSLLSYGFLGLMIMVIIIIPVPIYVQMSICFGMIMFMIMMTMISDFSSVLLDVKGRNILLTKPIDQKTFNAAKVIHIFIYMFIITMVMAGPSLIAGTIKYGILFFLLFILELTLLAGFVIFLTALLYSVILKFFDGEKLKDIINYFQIILSITMIIVYQLIGRMFEFIDLNVSFTPKWWSALIPPAWFAAPFELFINNNYESIYIYFGALCILIPVIALVIHAKVIVPHFESNLSKLNNSSAKNGISAERKGYLSKKSSKIFSHGNMENIFYRFTQNMLSNERKLKLKIYPSLAMAAVFPFLMLIPYFSDFSSLKGVFSRMAESKAYLSIYLAVLMLSNTIMMISTSENFKGSWIYRTLPIESPGPIYRGALKGYLVKYCIPIYLFVSIVFLIIYRFTIIIDLILILIGMILLTLVLFKTSKMELPFSDDIQKAQSGNTGVFFTTLIFVGTFVGIHIALSKVKLLLIAYTVVVLVVTIYLWKKSFDMKWEDVVDSIEK